MSVYRVSYRYANSFFQLVVEKNVFGKTSADAQVVYNTLASSKELRTVLKSPVIKSENKQSILSQLFSSKISVELMSFIGFVVEKGREDILFEIMKEFLALCDKKNNIIRAKVYSAVELGQNEKNRIKKEFEVKTGKIVEAEFTVRESLIGGFTIKIDDTVYDASVVQQLKLLQKKFAQESIISNN